MTTAMVSTVECVICMKTHLETPPPRDTGEYDARDWTYYRDSYKGVYSVVCKQEHDALLAPELSKLES